jgi:hypothetical protein
VSDKLDAIHLGHLQVAHHKTKSLGGRLHECQSLVRPFALRGVMETQLRQLLRQQLEHETVVVK